MVESKREKYQHGQRTWQGGNHQPSADNIIIDQIEGQADLSPLSDSVDLAMQAYLTSSVIYEMIDDVERCIQQSSNYNGTLGKPVRTCHLTALLKIVEATRRTERRFWLPFSSSGSQAFPQQPKTLEGFLKDYWTSSATFRELTEFLAQITASDDWENHRLAHLKTRNIA
ncbi:MAG: hypothetical protein O2913_05595 [Chloroflexi bacterium]|nr:hypothetical protein [Chloroflexota bacterium]